MLFNLGMEKISHTAVKNIHRGVKVNGKRIHNVSYADDTAFIADTAEELQIRLVINVKKTEFMVISREGIHLEVALLINEKHIKRVSSFKFLGAVLNQKCDDAEEIPIRV